MSTLPHYALFGSLIAGAAGALILSVVTITHGLRRRETSDPAHRQRLLRIADAAALLCFAVAAGFATLGLTQQIRAVPPAQAAAEDGALIAFGWSTGGSEKSVLRVVDRSSGRLLPDEITVSPELRGRLRHVFGAAPLDESVQDADDLHRRAVATE